MAQAPFFHGTNVNKPPIDSWSLATTWRKLLAIATLDRLDKGPISGRAHHPSVVKPDRCQLRALSVRRLHAMENPAEELARAQWPPLTPRGGSAGAMKDGQKIECVDFVVE